MGEEKAEKRPMSDVEAEVWDELWDTDAARSCSCPACNYYAPDYEQRQGEPCLLQTLVERIVHERVAQALETVAREWQSGGWTILTAPPPTGSIASLALGQRVTDWLRARPSRPAGGA